MTRTSFLRFLTTTTIVLVVTSAVPVLADLDALLRIERHSGEDRNTLIDAGVTLIAEVDDAFLAIGSPLVVEAAVAATGLGVEIVDPHASSAVFALVGLRSGWTDTDLLVCGEVVARGRDWRLVRGDGLTTPECRESAGWFLHVLRMEPLSATRPSAAREPALTPMPLVQEMVDRVDTPFALAHWAALSASPDWTTRYSSSQGCFDAAAYVHDLFGSLGLSPVYQHHTGGQADNVVGTIPGMTSPDEVTIAIGHLDDLPSSGLAPGADDNASGTAMVTAVAEIMSDYCFARTVKFIAVTGEEQGLNGSDYYADTAAAANENIVAVLNADMIGWEGDGQPATEDLDVNYNSASQWLAQAMVDAAAEYGTGLTVNAFLCSSMVYSDHAPFWSNGYAAVCGITDNEGFCGQGGDYPYYHQSSDTIANCGADGPDFEAAAIRTYLATLAHLAQPVARIPEPPTDLAAQADGPNRIALSWAPQDPGIEFTIYRAAGGCASPGPATLVGQSSSAAFVDTAASGGVPYAYTVVATTGGSCTSSLSQCVEATTTGSCTEPPTFAGVDEVTNAAGVTCRLTAGWQPPTQVWCGGPVAYNVYRSATPGFTPAPDNRVAELLGATTFVDDDVISNRWYHYIVRAVDLAHGGEDANAHEVAGSPTGPIDTWVDDAGDSGVATLIPQAPWSVAPSGGNFGPHVYRTGTYGNDVCASVTTPSIRLGGSSSLSFWSKYEIEGGWDKGVVEISSDGGLSWEKVPVDYPGSSTYSYDACDLPTGAYFTGSTTGLVWTEYGASLSGWTNQDVIMRWRLSTDGSVTYSGWWVDDIAVTIAGTCIGADTIFADGFESGGIGAWSN